MQDIGCGAGELLTLYLLLRRWYGLLTERGTLQFDTPFPNHATQESKHREKDGERVGVGTRLHSTSNRCQVKKEMAGKQYMATCFYLSY